MKKSIILCISLLFFGCTKSREKDEAAIPENATLGETYVDTIHLHRQVFNNQIVCNGHLRATKKSELSFTKQGIVKEILVHEGEYVAKGALIANLDKRERQRELERAQHELERSKVAYTDKLIGLGYSADLHDVPEDVATRTEVTSGYYSAKYELQSAQTALAECSLYAPFSGRIADIQAKPHQPGEKICTLIDDSAFDVEFKVLEAELSHVRIGGKVSISPFVDDSLICKGRITQINPIVDEKGLVRIHAHIASRNKQLIDGMNVRIVVDGEDRTLFVVPKDAVVERDGYHVVFLFQDGQAVWTYVDVLHSNINAFAITGCKRKNTTIQDGDAVITSGNLNLADGTEVKVSAQ